MTYGRASIMNAFLRTFVSMRFVSLFLILFGLAGVVVWPVTALHFTSVTSGVESTLESAATELQKLQQALNESYSQLDILEKSTIDFGDRLNTVVDIVNNISSSLSAASANVDEISRMLIQASESWELRLISEDFAETLRNTGDSLKDLSQAIQSVNFQDFLVEVKAVEDIVHIGIQIISFLKNAFKTFSVIAKDIAIRFESLDQALETVKYVSFILAVDAALIHLSLAIIGVVFRRKYPT